MISNDQEKKITKLGMKLKCSERTNRTRTSSSSIEPGSSMRFDGSIELESSIHRTKIEPNPYLNEPFSTNIQQTKRKNVKK